MKAINSILVVNRAFQDCHRPIRLGISLAKKFQSIMSLEKNQGFLEKEYIRKGKPAIEIMDTINKENIDLTILLAHKEGHLEHLFGGSDTDKIVSKLPCSVLLLDEDKRTTN